MKKSAIKVLSVLLVCLLFLCACSHDSSSSDSTTTSSRDSLTFSSDLRVFLGKSKISILNRYESDYFRKNACTFDKDLAILTHALAFSSSRDSAVTNLENMLFEDIKKYENSGNKDGCTYIISHRKVDNYELVAVYIKGLGYDIEWAGNLTLGDTGTHLGFKTAADEVYSNLKTYLNNYCSQSSLKLWITGYSRTAAIADVLAVDIITNAEIEIDQKDLFVYAFEPPTSVADDTEYPCIHNIFVESDLVPAVPPTSYGLSRPGVDHKLSSSVDNLNDCLHKYVSTDVSMPTFTSSTDYSTPAEFLEYFVNGVTCSKTDSSAASLESRATYYSDIQPRIVYLAEVLLKNDSKGLNALINSVKNNLALALPWITGDSFYNSLYPMLDTCGTEYNADTLKNACSIVPSLYLNTDLVSFLTAFATDSDKMNNAMYLISCHNPEVCYALLKGTDF